MEHRMPIAALNALSGTGYVALALATARTAAALDMIVAVLLVLGGLALVASAAALAANRASSVRHSERALHALACGLALALAWQAHAWAFGGRTPPFQAAAGMLWAVALLWPFAQMALVRRAGASRRSRLRWRLPLLPAMPVRLSCASPSSRRLA